MPSDPVTAAAVDVIIRLALLAHEEAHTRGVCTIRAVGTALTKLGVPLSVVVDRTLFVVDALADDQANVRMN